MQMLDWISKFMMQAKLLLHCKSLGKVHGMAGGQIHVYTCTRTCVRAHVTNYITSFLKCVHFTSIKMYL